MRAAAAGHRQRRQIRQRPPTHIRHLSESAEVGLVRWHHHSRQLRELQHSVARPVDARWAGRLEAVGRCRQVRPPVTHTQLGQRRVRCLQHTHHPVDGEWLEGGAAGVQDGACAAGGVGLVQQGALGREYGRQVGVVLDGREGGSDEWGPDGASENRREGVGEGQRHGAVVDTVKGRRGAHGRAHLTHSAPAHRLLLHDYAGLVGLAG
mmetsp:Transcript_36450/g.104463  ORF Transcript_36450/g.104463 Transcript_36450/m.104463 type:complete len:208 (+) Transcript_36450:741-1364(+)